MLDSERMVSRSRLDELAAVVALNAAARNTGPHADADLEAGAAWLRYVRSRRYAVVAPDRTHKPVRAAARPRAPWWRRWAVWALERLRG